MTLSGSLYAWATRGTARRDITHPCPSMLLVRFVAPDRMCCLIRGLFPGDKRPRSGGALQRNRTGVFVPLNTNTTHIGPNVDGYLEKLRRHDLPAPQDPVYAQCENIVHVYFESAIIQV